MKAWFAALVLFSWSATASLYAGPAADGQSSHRMSGDSAADVLAGFSAEARALLAQEIFSPAFEGVVSAGRVAALLHLHQAGLDSIQEVMRRLLPVASGYALAPISDFHVGAIAQGASGALYLGANLEIRHSALGFAVHAEQSAINNAVLHGERTITRLAVTAAPCGHCRQFMNELDTASELEIIVRDEPPVSLSRLLPRAFSPRDLGLARGLLAARTPARQCRTWRDDRLACQGIAAIRHSYAPHSLSPATITVRTDEATVVGAYIENAAYNPSLPPLQSALDRLRFKQRGISGITEVVLVEMAAAKISQRHYTQAVLAAIAPAANFRVVTLK